MPSLRAFRALRSFAARAAPEESARSAFTLVEVLIVVIILGILAAVVVPQFSNAAQESLTVALQTTLAHVRTQIDRAKYLGASGAYPAAIDANWFVPAALPKHPQNSIGLAAVEVVTNASLRHPANKVLATGVAGAYWYNTSTGDFRARVGDMGSSASTLAFYNRVNQSSETSLGNYGGGGGS